MPSRFINSFGPTRFSLRRVLNSLLAGSGLCKAKSVLSFVLFFELQLPSGPAPGASKPEQVSHLRPSRNRLIALASMIHHIVLYKLKPEVTPARVEEMMMNARMQLLKIPEVLSIKCGKRIDPETPWPFFIAIDFESMDKFAIFREDPIYVKFMEEIIKPNICRFAQPGF